MAGYIFRKGKRKDIFLYKTTVENLFINEFLPDAPGDYVKVFLFGSMYAQYDETLDTRTMALTLGMTEAEVTAAWRYWEKRGLVTVTGSESDRNEIEFVRLIEMFYGKSGGNYDKEENGREDAIATRLIDKQLKEIFEKFEGASGRPLSMTEAGKLTDLVKVYNAAPEVVTYAIKYCEDIDKVKIDYICTVVLRWTENGCRNITQVKELLERHSKRNEAYRKVFQELGFSRQTNPTDREIMDKWFDEMGCSLMEVIDACKAAAGIREPSLKYVNKVLENKILEKGGVNTRKDRSSNGDGSRDRYTANREQSTRSEAVRAKVSRKVLSEYYDHIRQEEQRKYYERIEELSAKVPEIKGIFAMISELNRAVISVEPSNILRRNELREQRRALEADKREILVRNGYPADYLEKKYRCEICKDSGYTDEGIICVCCRDRAEEAYKWIRESGKY